MADPHDRDDRLAEISGRHALAYLDLLDAREQARREPTAEEVDVRRSASRRFAFLIDRAFYERKKAQRRAHLLAITYREE